MMGHDLEYLLSCRGGRKVIDRPTFDVMAHRVEDWWVIEVSGEPGCHTQAHSSELIEPTTRDVIAHLLDVAPHSFDLNIRIVNLTQ
jgi:hypothetical protein